MRGPPQALSPALLLYSVGVVSSSHSTLGLLELNPKMPTHIETAASDILNQVINSSLTPAQAAQALQEAFYKGLALANQKVDPEAKRDRAWNAKYREPMSAVEKWRAADDAALLRKIDALGKPNPGRLSLVDPDTKARAAISKQLKAEVGGRLGRLGNQADQQALASMKPHELLAHPQLSNYLGSQQRAGLSGKPLGLLGKAEVSVGDAQMAAVLPSPKDRWQQRAEAIKSGEVSAVKPPLLSLVGRVASSKAKALPALSRPALNPATPIARGTKK